MILDSGLHAKDAGLGARCRPAAALLGAALLLAGACGRAEASVPAVTQRDAITIGYQNGAFPFAYLDASGRHVGYAVELCERVVRELGRVRGRPVEVRPFAVTSRNRIAYLLAGRIDLECGSTSNTAARARLGVRFSPVTFVSDVAVLARTDVPGLRAVDDLKQLGDDAAPVVTTAGSTAGRYVRDLKARLDARFPLATAANHAESFRMLADGRASAFVMDRVLLKGWLAWQGRCSPETAASLRLLDGVVAAEAVEHYGLMMREADADLHDVVKRTLESLMRSNEVAAIYARWFMEPIPGAAQFGRCAVDAAPRAIGMDMPPALREVFLRPTDRPFEASRGRAGLR